MQPEATYRGASGGSSGAAASPRSSQPSTQAAPKESPANSPQACAMNAGLMGLMAVMMYFLIIRPQRKQQKDHEERLRSLKRGVFVRTSGGIRGEVMDMGETDVMLMIADKVKVNVLKTHIASVEGSHGETAK